MMLSPLALWDALFIGALNHAIRKRRPGYAAYTLDREEGVPRAYRFSDPLCVNDKFTWRKIFDHDPRFTLVSDKLAVKPWVARLETGLQIAPVLWEGADAREIPDEVLNGPAMLKANHGCATNIALRGPPENREALVDRANGFLKVDYGRDTGEWGYYNIPRRLFVEEWCGAPDAELEELKFYAFGGQLHRVVHIGGRFTRLAATVYDRTDDGHWAVNPRAAAVSSVALDRPLPPSLEAAEHAARLLGQPFDHMRVDILTDGHTCWFGELTVYNLSGYMSLSGHLPDARMALDWDLRQSWFLTTRQRGWRGAYANALHRRISRRDARRSNGE